MVAPLKRFLVCVRTFAAQIESKDRAVRAPLWLARPPLTCSHTPRLRSVPRGPTALPRALPCTAQHGRHAQAAAAPPPRRGSRALRADRAACALGEQAQPQLLLHELVGQLLHATHRSSRLLLAYQLMGGPLARATFSGLAPSFARDSPVVVAVRTHSRAST
jgi:hypothetical protein